MVAPNNSPSGVSVVRSAISAPGSSDGRGFDLCLRLRKRFSK